MRFSISAFLCIFFALPFACCDEPQVNAEVKNQLGAAASFDIEVMSILSKAGCNAGTCHGNLNGKGGFKLSLRGQDPQFDFESLVAASRGRRVNLVAPTRSLLLQKATGQVAHRGGIRFAKDSAEYEELHHWLLQGANGPDPSSPRVVSLSVSPGQAIVRAPEQSLQVHVEALFSDGQKRDVTHRACFELSNLNATVSPAGLVERKKLGESTLIVRYLDQQKAIPVAFVDPPDDFRWKQPESYNLVDSHVFDELERLSIGVSPACDDSTFIRRAMLDVAGRLPTAEEAKQFVNEVNCNKRGELIDRLLASPEFADYWALKFADILRVEEKVLDPAGVDIFHAWIREQIFQGVAHDQFVRALVTGTGSTFQNPAANFYRANRDPATRGETTARLFLGTRLQCAKCHNHPFDRWTQEDYYRWSTVFSQIDYEIGDNKRKDRLDKNEFAGDQVVLVSKQNEVKNPTTQEFVSPKFLGGDELASTDGNGRLAAVAEWLTAPANELFVKSQVNFVWYHIMGQGLVDPIDDFRLTNPASNPALLKALADHFRETNFDLRRLIRTVMLSRTYQAASEPTPSNEHDSTCFSKAAVRRLGAEVLLDMQSDFLGSPAEFAGHDAGLRAVQVPGVKRVRSRDKTPRNGDRFLKTFGKPERILACDCERSNETNLQQVLGLLGDGLNQRLADSPRIKQLAASRLADAEVVAELYWAALSRPPSGKELTAGLQLLQMTGNREIALQDIAWALLNAKEFLFRN